MNVIRYLHLLSHRMPSWLLMLSAIMFVAGCQTSPKISTSPEFETTQHHTLSRLSETQALEKLYQQHATWQGTPYRLGGNSRSGIDCSAFVQTTFDDVFNIKLPRTTNQQIRIGEKIGRSDLQAGDLVFFRNGRHVGIYLEDDRFLHASTRLGVTISRMDNVYWSRYYWRSIRIQTAP